MDIKKEDIQHLSTLAKIELSEEEKRSIQKDLQGIFSFVESINALSAFSSIDDVPPTRQVTGLRNVIRKDEANYTFEKSDMVATMPNTDEEGHLIVHAVFTGDSPSN